MKKNIMCSLFALCIISALYSCGDEGTITITNKVHNVKLEKLSIASESINGTILTGESTSRTFSESSDSDIFPIEGVIKFYMVSNGNRVYLHTVDRFRLDKKKKLVVEITDETEVINPLNSSKTALGKY